MPYQDVLNEKRTLAAQTAEMEALNSRQKKEHDEVIAKLDEVVKAINRLCDRLEEPTSEKDK